MTMPTSLLVTHCSVPIDDAITIEYVVVYNNKGNKALTTRKY